MRVGPIVNGYCRKGHSRSAMVAAALWHFASLPVETRAALTRDYLLKAGGDAVPVVWDGREPEGPRPGRRWLRWLTLGVLR